MSERETESDRFSQTVGSVKYRCAESKQVGDWSSLLHSVDPGQSRILAGILKE